MYILLFFYKKVKIKKLLLGYYNKFILIIFVKIIKIINLYKKSAGMQCILAFSKGYVVYHQSSFEEEFDGDGLRLCLIMRYCSSPVISGVGSFWLTLTFKLRLSSILASSFSTTTLASLFSFAILLPFSHIWEII